LRFHNFYGDEFDVYGDEFVVEGKTYHHSHPSLLSIRLLLDRIVQDYIQKDVVAAQGARDAAGAVELD